MSSFSVFYVSYLVYYVMCPTTFAEVVPWRKWWLTWHGVDCRRLRPQPTPQISKPQFPVLARASERNERSARRMTAARLSLDGPFKL